MLRTGIFGGSFNPLHSGHIAIGEYFYRSGSLDEVWFVVSPQNPLKDSNILAQAETRLEDCRKALEAYPHLQVSDVEFHLPRPSYMAQTLQHLQKQHPDREFSLIIGGDNLDHFQRWKDYRFLLDNFDILVYPRPGSRNIVPADWKRVRLFNDAPQMSISSTEIRKNKNKS